MSENLMTFMIGPDDSPHLLGVDTDDEKATYKWLLSADGIYSLCVNSDVQSRMEPGMYSIFQDGRGNLHVEEDEPITDELYDLPHKTIPEVMKEIETFWNEAPRFKKYKMKHKRGILLEGPGGTGKTSIINILASKIVQNGGLVFIIREPNDLVVFVEFMHRQLRKVEPDRPVVAVIEDIDTFCEVSSTEKQLLAFLDGEDSVDHLITVATTNRFEDLNDLVLRSSRFDHHVTVGHPAEDVKKAYLLNKGLDEETSEKWANDTDSFSFADLKELFSSVILLDVDYKKTKAKIKGNVDNVVNKTERKSRANKTKVGFALGTK